MYRKQIETILALDNATRNITHGVYAMDRLPQRKPGAYVINADNHDEPGSHWMAVFCTRDRIEFMDSYGRPPPDARLLQFLGSNYSYNTVPLQKPLSNACGFYCLYFLLHRARGHSATSIIELLRRSDSDYVVKEYVYSRYKPIFV